MSDNQNWRDTQAQLLHDIDAFARRKLDLGAADAVEKKPREAGFPAIAANAAPVAPAPASAAKPAAANQPQPATPAPGGSLLERLKREAQERQTTESQRFTLQAQKQRFISDALRQAFDYFRELTEQLNVVRPPVPTAYNLLNLATLDVMFQ